MKNKLKIKPVKSKNIRKAISQAYKHFNSDNEEWAEGMDILANLLGIKVNKISCRPTTIAELTAIGENQLKTCYFCKEYKHGCIGVCVSETELDAEIVNICPECNKRYRLKECI